MEENQLLHELELAFFGTVTASVSHELNNVLSIINEYCGLLDDLVSANNKGVPIENDRIQKITSNIARQIKREQEIIKLLNRFAHRIDTPVVQFNLNQLISDIRQLSQRFASLKKIELGITLPEEQITLTSNPFAVQHAIFLCLKLALDYSTIADNITIVLEINQLLAIITIESPVVEKNQTTEKIMKLISLLLKNLGGDIKNTTGDSNRYLQQISIPFSFTNGANDH